MSVVVYNGRSPQAVVDPKTGGLVLSGEHPFQATFNPSGNVITLLWNPGDDPPSVRKGGWVLDATLGNTGSPSADVRGYFYRVVNATESGANSLDLEIQGTLKSSGTTGWVVIMDNVMEVYNRGTN